MSLSIRTDSFLWKFYIKSFKQDDKTAEYPKDVCHYITGVYAGMCWCITREISLLKLWFFVVALLCIIVTIDDALHTNNTGYMFIFERVLVVCLFFALLTTITLTILRVWLATISFFDTSRWSDRTKFWISNAIIVCTITCILLFVEDPWQQLLSLAKIFVSIIGACFVILGVWVIKYPLLLEWYRAKKELFCPTVTIVSKKT